MATDPKARRITVGYPGGTMSATIGLVEYLLGAQKLVWSKPTSGETADGKRKRKYGTKQRATALSGRPMTIVLDNGESYTARVSGADIDFIEFVLARTEENKVLNIYSPRGTIYGPQFPEEAALVPTPPVP
jgi:hypothetical protein